MIGFRNCIWFYICKSIKIILNLFRNLESNMQVYADKNMEQSLRKFENIMTEGGH